MGWQSIETAPKDGTPILAFWFFSDSISGDNYGVAEFRDGEWRPADPCDNSEWCEPSHWMPLPEPPQLDPRT